MPPAKAAAANKLRPLASVVAVGSLSLAAAAALPMLRNRIVETLSAPGLGWKVVALAMVVLNLKQVPFVWHIRLFRALLYHLYFQPTDLPKEALFLPVITQSYTPAMEVDYNLHKSNSTYFADLDIARTHLVSAVLRKGIRGVGKFPENKGNVGWSFRNTSRAAGTRKDGLSAEERATEEAKNREREEAAAKEEQLVKAVKKSPMKSLSASTAQESGLNTPSGTHTPTRVPIEPTLSTSPSPSRTAWGSNRMTEEEWWSEATKPGNLLIALGGNSCHYHREIPPYKRFEIWSRILAWDRKWIYMVSHFVEKDAFKPSSYILQPWKDGAATVVNNGAPAARSSAFSAEEKAKLKRKIYASSISKYVVKKGRLTIPPELVLMRSEMLPARPPGAPSTFFTPSPEETPPTRVSETGSPASSTLDNVLEESLFPSTGSLGPTTAGEEGWTWERVERMRQEGMKLASLFDGLDGLRDAFDDGSENGAMGHYPDL